MNAGREFHSITAGSILWGLYLGGNSRFRLPGVPKKGELQEASKEAFKAYPKRDQSQEGVGRRPWPKKGVLGRGLRLQRPVLVSEVSGG